MKKTALILIFSISFTIVFAGKIEKAFQALEEYNYFEAKELFEKSLSKKKIAASFGLSIIYVRNDNPFHNLDSAYKYICIADSNFLEVEDKLREKLNLLKVDSLKIQALKDTIDKKAYELVRNSKDVVLFQNYINKHTDSKYRVRVIDSRNALLFEEAKRENTSKSYQDFFSRFPEANDAIEAMNRYEERLYFEQTIGGRAIDYKRFIYNGTFSPYLRRAQDSLYSILTRNKDIDSYYNFIIENPFNPNIEEAWRQVYKLYMTDYSPAKIVEFRIDYPNYPFIEELKVDIKLAAKPFLPFKRNGKWGFIDEEGEVVIPPIYESVEVFSEGLALVVKDSKVGFIDKAEKTIIPFEYADGESFQNGLAIVAKDDYYGIVDRTNREIIPIKYEFVSQFNDGLALIADDNYYGYCNSKGEIVIPLRLDYASDFDNGYAIVEVEGKKGMINTLGKLVLPLTYNWLESFNEFGLCRVKKDSLYGMLDRNGAEVLPLVYNHIGKFKNNRALVSKDRKYGYASKNGIEEIALEYDYATEALIWGEFENGFAKFFLKDKYGIIDTTGQKIFPAIFQDVGSYQLEGFTAVKKRGKWGYSDQNLKLVIPYIYDYASTFSNNKAIVKKDSLFGIINKQGKWLINPEYEMIQLIDEVGFLTQMHKKKGLLDLDLNPLLGLDFDVIQPSSTNKELLLVEQGSNSFYYNYQEKRYLGDKASKP